MMDFIAGARYLARGFRLLRTPGLRRYVVLPLLINAVLFASLIALGGHAFGQLVAGWMAVIPGWLQWLEWVLWPMFALAAAVVVFFTFTLFANLIGAPFNDLLAAAVERHLTGATTESDGGGTLMAGMIPALHGELWKLGYFLLRAIPLLLLFLVPVINAAAPLIWALFGSWMLALEYLDYPLGNHGVPFPRQRQLLRQRRGLTLGFGAATLVASMIPLINFVVMPAAVAGATALYVAQIRPSGPLTRGR